MAEQTIVSGTTRLIAIIGDPVAQVKAPTAFNPRLVAAGIDAIVVPMHVRAERFDETVRGLMALGNLDGIVVTVPFKSRIVAFADRRLASAATIEAANAVRREPDGSWTCEMFDGIGLIRGLEREGIASAGRRVMLVGAGGGGSAVAAAFAQGGAAAVTIHDVDVARAEALARRVATAFPACEVRAGAPDLDAHDTLVNATPIGMKPDDPLPVRLDGLRPEMLVVDIIMKPEVTRLLETARRHGCRALGGRVMLEGQAGEVLRFFGFEAA